jgi:DNA-binding transcriptional MerR regulator
MLGIPAATIRTWETRYDVLAPERRPGGGRRYTRDQLEQLAFVKSQIAAGVNVADAHRLLASHLEKGVDLVDPQASAHRVLILLAERDAHAADLEEYFLKTEGYEVAIIHDAEEAETYALDRRPDVIVVELLISGGRGADLCRRLKEHGLSPILATSPLATELHALDSGADAFLQKPFEPLQFVSTVKDLIRASALVRPGSGRAR